MTVGAALVVADRFAGPDVTFVGVFVIVPFLASVAARPSITAAVGVATCLMAVALAIRDNVTTSELLLRAAINIAGACLATFVAVRRERRERQLSDINHVADAVQRAILAPLPSQLGDVTLTSRYLSAAKSASVGGDCFEAVPSKFGDRILMADVRGHGLDAVRLSTVVLGAFRETARYVEDLCQMARSMEERLMIHFNVEDFVTAVIVEISDATSVRVVNCGHPGPLVLDNGRFQIVEPGDPTTPLGLETRPQEQTVSFRNGSRLLLYTDGLTDRLQAGGSHLEMADLAQDLLGGSLEDALDAVVRRVVTSAREESGDDCALVLLGR